MSFLDSLFGIKDAKNAATNAANQNRQVSNDAYARAENIQNPYYQQGTQANTVLGNYLGLNGQGAQQQAYDGYVAGPDVQYRLSRGIDAIDNSSAARTGGVPSGGLLKRLNEFGTGVATQDLGNYLTRLAGQSAQGQTAANALTNANYQSAGLTTGANTAEGNAIANASLAGGNILQNLITGGMNLAGNLGFNPFGKGGGNTQQGTMTGNRFW